ncbi:hypothetical protein D3C83_78480 [compost metagenome]
MRGPVLVLQSFAREGSAAGRAANQEAARARIGRRPGKVTDPLEAEDGVINVEGQHCHAMRRIAGCSRDPGGH